ncbi:putative 3-methyladenine DNA glycosylase [Methanimicrococcus sp. At1]|uniref:Putative 3-methyladenine DNA glycosylase n=1 Tax=Methanimicrococcus hacksteinii TaxID=3028293 RepID=A0ABU3VM63_9EURY|nr:DNA-3-methyladenine glycosylase [Methanimicrococcus sp. At1]MDV0444492.1 putative 3-methyladenine DNA glycosylase [Methanimicrococcus sp. At1]
MTKSKRLTLDFYARDVLEVAPDLIGKILVRRLPTGEILRLRITETEAYRGEEDTGCHAKAGKTNRTVVLYGPPGRTYVYLCYGVHHLINAVTGKDGQPQAALLRGLEGNYGPGRLTKAMQITKELNDDDLTTSEEIWIEDDGTKPEYVTGKRIGIDYADDHYRNIEWRFTAPSEIKPKKTVKINSKQTAAKKQQQRAQKGKNEKK